MVPPRRKREASFYGNVPNNPPYFGGGFNNAQNFAPPYRRTPYSSRVNNVNRHNYTQENQVIFAANNLQNGSQIYGENNFGMASVNDQPTNPVNGVNNLNTTHLNRSNFYMMQNQTLNVKSNESSNQIKVEPNQNHEIARLMNSSSFKTNEPMTQNANGHFISTQEHENKQKSDPKVSKMENLNLVRSKLLVDQELGLEECDVSSLMANKVNREGDNVTNAYAIEEDSLSSSSCLSSVHPRGKVLCTENRKIKNEESADGSLNSKSMERFKEDLLAEMEVLNSKIKSKCGEDQVLSKDAINIDSQNESNFSNVFKQILQSKKENESEGRYDFIVRYLNDRLNECKCMISNFKSSLEKSIEREANLKSTLMTTQTKLETERKKREEEGTKWNEVAEKNILLEKNLRTMKMLYEKQMEENSVMKFKLQRAEKEALLLKERSTKLNSELANLRKGQESTTKENAEAKKKMEDLIHELMKYEEENLKLKDSLQEKEKSHSILADEKTKIENELSGLKNESGNVLSLNAKYERVMSRMHEMESNYLNADKEKEKLMIKLKEEAKKLAVVAAEKGKLVKSLKEMNDQFVKVKEENQKLSSAVNEMHEKMKKNGEADVHNLKVEEKGIIYAPHSNGDNHSSSTETTLNSNSNSNSNSNDQKQSSLRETKHRGLQILDQVSCKINEGLNNLDTVSQNNVSSDSMDAKDKGKQVAEEFNMDATASATQEDAMKIIAALKKELEQSKEREAKLNAAVDVAYEALHKAAKKADQLKFLFQKG